MWFSLFLKRFFDIVFSILGIIILFIPFIVIAILIKCDSKGPVFFRQERRTKNGRIFKMYKFRTMVVNAENQGAGLFNYKDDPRVTKIGAKLRRGSIDELPQLFNVIKGDLSLVGPRPCVKYELGDFDTLNRKYKKRFCMRSGITGLAQVEGRNDITWDKKVEWDNEYIDRFKKHGIFTDIRILWKTFIKVFKKENIYENKEDDSLDDIEAAKIAEEEIIRLAHLPDDNELFMPDNSESDNFDKNIEDNATYIDDNVDDKIDDAIEENIDNSVIETESEKSVDDVEE